MNPLQLDPPSMVEFNVWGLSLKSPLQHNQPHLELERDVALIPMKSPLQLYKPDLELDRDVALISMKSPLQFNKPYLDICIAPNKNDIGGIKPLRHHL